MSAYQASDWDRGAVTGLALTEAAFKSDLSPCGGIRPDLPTVQALTIMAAMAIVDAASARGMTETEYLAAIANELTAQHDENEL